MAIFTALTAITLLGVGAVAIDVGNAVARRERAQLQVDQAAFAGTSQIFSAIPEEGAPQWPEDAALLTAVAASLSANTPRDDGGGFCLDEVITDAFGCVTPAELIDEDESNGEVSYVDGALRVVGPKARVSFALGQVLQDSRWTDVQGSSTVGVYSPEASVMPAFAVAGCDFGRQTLTDPASGHVTAVVPTLSFASDLATAVLSAVTPTQLDTAATAPVPPVTVTLSGKRFTTVTKMGFFKPDGSAPVEAPIKTAGGGLLPALGFTSLQNNTTYSLTADLPDVVATTEGLWYVRVFTKLAIGGGIWSPVSTAQPIRIGNPVLECSAGSSDGNFGTLRIDRTDVSPALDLAVNMATSVQPPITMTIHDGTGADGLCAHGVDGAVETAGDILRPGTNCVATDPGLSANAATQGLITGITTPNLTIPGRLVGSNSPRCTGLAGQPAARVITLANRSLTLNNDTLSCFLTSGSLADITSPTYSGGSRLDRSILDSPRLYYVPVVKVDPGNGASKRYSIIDFRPAFITDELVAASTIAPGTQTIDNGLTLANNGLTTMRVIFFHADALPRPEDADVMDYLGVGKPIVRLVD